MAVVRPVFSWVDCWKALTCAKDASNPGCLLGGGPRLPRQHPRVFLRGGLFFLQRPGGAGKLQRGCSWARNGDVACVQTRWADTFLFQPGLCGWVLLIVLCLKSC